MGFVGSGRNGWLPTNTPEYGSMIRQSPTASLRWLCYHFVAFPFAQYTLHMMSKLGFLADAKCHTDSSISLYQILLDDDRLYRTCTMTYHAATSQSLGSDPTRPTCKSSVHLRTAAQCAQSRGVAKRGATSLRRLFLCPNS